MNIFVVEKRNRTLSEHRMMPCDDSTAEWVFFKVYFRESVAKETCIKLLSDRWHNYRVVEYAPSEVKA